LTSAPAAPLLHWMLDAEQMVKIGNRYHISKNTLLFIEISLLCSSFESDYYAYKTKFHCKKIKPLKKSSSEVKLDDFSEI
jgi:hypothetical protein